MSYIYIYDMAKNLKLAPGAQKKFFVEIFFVIVSVILFEIFQTVPQISRLYDVQGELFYTTLQFWCRHQGNNHEICSGTQRVKVSALHVKRVH